jgi:hypothetical protein
MTHDPFLPTCNESNSREMWNSSPNGAFCPSSLQQDPVIDLANMSVRSSMSVVRILTKFKRPLFLRQLLNEMFIVNRRIRSSVGGYGMLFVRPERNARVFPSARCSGS